MIRLAALLALADAGDGLVAVWADGQTPSGLWGPGAGGHEVAKRAGARQI